MALILQQRWAHEIYFHKDEGREMAGEPRLVLWRWKTPRGRGEKNIHQERIPPCSARGLEKKSLKKRAKKGLPSEDDIEESWGGGGWSGSFTNFLTGMCGFPERASSHLRLINTLQEMSQSGSETRRALQQTCSSSTRRDAVWCCPIKTLPF